MRADPVVLTPADLRVLWPDLRDAAAVALDLREGPVDRSVARLDGAIFLGCVFPGGVWERLATSGAVVFTSFEGLPFQPYRSPLYSYEELTAGHEDGVEATLDTHISSWFASSSSMSLTDLACAPWTMRRWMPRSLGSSTPVEWSGSWAVMPSLVMPPSTARLCTCDDPFEAVAFIDRDPYAGGRAGSERRRAHQDS